VPWVGPNTSATGRSPAIRRAVRQRGLVRNPAPVARFGTYVVNPDCTSSQRFEPRPVVIEDRFVIVDDGRESGRRSSRRQSQWSPPSPSGFTRADSTGRRPGRPRGWRRSVVAPAVRLVTTKNSPGRGRLDSCRWMEVPRSDCSAEIHSATDRYLEGGRSDPATCRTSR
jgi:hypothetical protein